MTERNKTINFFCHVYLPQTGGIERYTSNFSDEMVRLGYKVNIITTDSHNLGNLALEKGKIIYRFSALNLMGDRFPVPYNLVQFYKVYKYLFKSQDTIVILNSRLFLTSLIGLILGKISGSKILLIEHGSSHIGYSSRLLTRIFAIYEHMITFIFRNSKIEFYGVSKACNEWLKHFKIEASGVIYNGVSIKKEDIKKVKLEKSKKRIAFVGRLIKEKGILELLEAFEIFSKKYSDYQLIIVGEGDLKNEVLKKTLKNENIKYLGKLNHSEVLGLLSKSDLFINPSNYAEGLPTTLLEAGYFGIPVISTPNGGSKEIIRNDKTGILIKNGDLKSILTALNLFAKNPEEYIEYGNNLRITIQNKFVWRNIAKQAVEKFNKNENNKLFFNLDLR